MLLLEAHVSMKTELVSGKALKLLSLAQDSPSCQASGGGPVVEQGDPGEDEDSEEEEDEESGSEGKGSAGPPAVGRVGWTG